MLSLRAATEADVEPLLDMMEDFNRLELVPWSREAWAPAVRRLVAAPELGTIGLIVEGDATRGYVVVTWGYDLEWNGRDAFLTEIYVVAGARGAGVGRQALALAEAHAVANGARALHLMVRPENEAAVRLYRGAGYISPPRVFMTKVLG